ncbi:MAG TPA: efflux RND transporter periplasmic adaptor subunit [Chitinophagales bacterium]|nr:efflux RND transporter periplasmic adaptor subunit [Chitinophagales bacterium]
MKKTISIIALAVFLLYIGFTLKKNKEIINANSENALKIEEYDYIPITVHKVKQGNLDQSIEEIGSFQARQELTITASTNGKLTRLNVQEGQYISKGAVIATIEHSALKSQLETTKAALANAKRDLERVTNAHKVGATTKMQIEQSELQVENLQSSIDGLNEQIKFYTITAPMSAYVNKVFIEQGSYAMPGAPIVELVDISTIKMVVKVNESVVPLLNIGDKIPVKTDVLPDKVLNGKISRIAVRSDASKKFEVEIDLPNKGNVLKSGMYGKVTFDHISTSESIYIPRSAIVGSINNAQVYTVTPDSTVHITPVSVGAFQGNNIEILKGLQIGDQVVLMGQINLREGVKVSVVQ